MISELTLYPCMYAQTLMIHRLNISTSTIVVWTSHCCPKWYHKCNNFYRYDLTTYYKNLATLYIPFNVACFVSLLTQVNDLAITWWKSKMMTWDLHGKSWVPLWRPLYTWAWWALDPWVYNCVVGWEVGGWSKFTLHTRYQRTINWMKSLQG